MLEAAMLGLPYSGHIPDFSQQPAQPYANGNAEAVLSPAVTAQRKLRQEQDHAYHQSLTVCPRHLIADVLTCYMLTGYTPCTHLLV